LTASSCANQLAGCLARLPKIRSALVALGGQVPGEFLQPGQPNNFQTSPQISALQNLYNNQLGQIGNLQYILELQGPIERQFGNLQPGQNGVPVSGLEGPEGNNAIPNLICLLRMKQEQLAQLMGNQQNGINALSQCANALSGNPQFAPHLQMINGLQSECGNELQNTPYQLSMCNNMINGLIKRLPTGVSGIVPMTTRFGIVKNIGNNLQGQILNAHKKIALQHVSQCLEAQA
jgi:hypothetical protein